MTGTVGKVRILFRDDPLLPEEGPANGPYCRAEMGPPGPYGMTCPHGDTITAYSSVCTRPPHPADEVHVSFGYECVIVWGGE